MTKIILRRYIAHLLPAVGIYFLMFWYYPAISVTNAFLCALQFPVLLLGFTGLGRYFPEENLKQRSLAFSIEFALLQGAVFSIFLTTIRSLSEPATNESLAQIAEKFGWVMLIFASAMLVGMLVRQHRLRKIGS